MSNSANSNVHQGNVNIGLEGVVVGETRVSDVDGVRGKLSYRSREIESLVEWPFAKVAWWVLFGGVASDEIDSDAWRNLEPLLVELGAITATEKRVLEQLPRHLHPMLMLQSLIPVMDLSPNCAVDLPISNKQAVAGLVIAAKIPTLIANWQQLRSSGYTVDYVDSPSFLGNFLHMFTGKQPSEADIQLLEIAQILQMEHGYNAGTFAGRVVSSTQSPVQSVIAASIGALYGSLHGGADQAALEMAEVIGNPDEALAYVRSALASKQKIMGMGHREYQVVDPRAKILKPLAVKNCTAPRPKQLLDVLIAVEQACQSEFAKRDKQIWANVEFYKGAVFYALGIAPEFFTSIFAMSRVFGYLAHFLEFQEAPRLIRPKAQYIGQRKGGAKLTVVN